MIGMRHVIKNSSEKGFSLVELMIVVGIIGVLATLALPRFKQFQAKAKMSEAKNILSHIYTLEHSYALDNNQFVAFAAFGAPGSLAACNPPAGAAQLGFRIDPCNVNVPRFAYSATSADASAFTATATTGVGPLNKVCPGNDSFNVTVDHNNQFLGTGATTAQPEVNIGSVCAK
jgi:prepilin-type N-terminal cleavage/methylation domain-containing protein